MGAAFVRKLHQDGFHVAVLSSSGKGEALARELGGIGVTGSNQSNDDLKQLVDATMQKWSRVDALSTAPDTDPAPQFLRSPMSSGTWDLTCIS